MHSESLERKLLLTADPTTDENSREREEKQKDIEIFFDRAHKIIKTIDKEEKSQDIKILPNIKEKLISIRDILEDIIEKLNRDKNIINTIKSHSNLIHEIGNFEIPLLVGIDKIKKLKEKGESSDNMQNIINTKINYFYKYLLDITKDEESFLKAITAEDWYDKRAA